MQIVTWNVAGLRARLFNLIEWIKISKADVICLQEVKAVESQISFSLFNDLGYEVILNGQPQFNGVAILYKKEIPLLNIETSNSILENDARYIEVCFEVDSEKLNIGCLYAPNGNPKYSDKYDYKLKWMEALYLHALANINKNIILAGDFNVIPNKIDAKNIELWLNDALYALEVRHLFKKIINLGFVDTNIINKDKHAYSFWDFRQNAWQRNNGIRIDFLLASPYIADKIIKSYDYKEVRDWGKPSDHIPVAVELNNI